MIPDLLLTGAFAHIDGTMIEFHHHWRKFTTDEEKHRKKQSIILQVCSVSLGKDVSNKHSSIYFQKALNTISDISTLLQNMDMDDEAYGVGEMIELPSCRQRQHRKGT